MAPEQQLTSGEYLSTLRKIIQLFYPQVVATLLPCAPTMEKTIVLLNNGEYDLSVQLLHARLPGVFAGLSATILRLLASDKAVQKELLMFPVEPLLISPSLPLVRVRGVPADASILTSGKNERAVIAAGVILTTIQYHRTNYRG